MHYPTIDPALVSLGPVTIYWYGLMYVLAFLGFYLLGRLRIARGAPGTQSWTPELVSDALFHGVVGVIVGGRLGFVFFYGFDRFLADPLWLLRIWEGGMSFHGGLIGVIAALFVFARRHRKHPLSMTDFAAPIVAHGLGLGRVGNFINGELPGRVTELPFGLHYPCHSVHELSLTCFGAFEEVLRHPSSLYQAFTEGIVLFAIVWLYAAKPRRVGQVSGCFLTAYGSLRICTEFFREPDAHIGFIAFDWLTMGQLLSLPMVALGIFLLMRKPAT